MAFMALRFPMAKPKVIPKLSSNISICPITGTVPGLTYGETYQFRVKAVNKEGASDPLETDKAIVAKNPYGLIDI